MENLRKQIAALKIELESLNRSFEDNRLEDSFRIIPHILTDTQELVEELDKVYANGKV
jgi:hypothetical protein